ncbi:WD repeat-containing protein 8 [Rickenella mellea]|uniref:WD repeat-containing protein 8 n=1 Tax=Rickenella mellea TaxID=50990 RepID=A0A4Y7QP40_9AGAM|nr:WD repeat-containing protein 8 [Rickenella mellea]
MDFTELYKQSASLVSFSPGAHFILNAVHDRLIVRRADSFQVTRTWLVDSSPSQTATALRNGPAIASGTPSSPDSAITHVAWSCDAEYLLSACARRGIVNVYKMRDEDWNVRIESGAEGLVKAEWSPDGRSIICFSEWGLRVTVWSLITGVATYIQYPTHPDRGYAFRKDGRYFVMAERHKSKDTVGVYDAHDSYKLVRHFSVPTSSLASLAISPTGNHLAVWEGPLEYKLCIFTLPGTLLATFAPDPDPGLGIRCVAWHPAGSFIAVGGWDDKIHVLDGLSWSLVATLQLSSRMHAGVTVWREPQNWLEATHGRGFLSYEGVHGPQSIQIPKPDLSKPHPKSGTVQLEWNIKGSLLLARYETIPTALFIYSFPSPSERFQVKLRSVLLQTNPIIQARWNPVRGGRLALCCGGGGMYMWSNEWSTEEGEGHATEEEVAECIGIPAKQFQVRDLKWAPDGKGLILLDKDTFCGAFEVEDGAA